MQRKDLPSPLRLGLVLSGGGAKGAYEEGVMQALARLGLASGVWREGALLLFVMFCAGLAALTVFPANFWTVWHWQAAFRGERPFSR